MDEGDLAAPLYLGILGKLNALRMSDSQNVVATAEMWHPVVERHQPTSELTGFPCSACGEPWPCTMIVDVVRALS